MGHTVFISYPASDNRAAHEICREIETTGVTCWIAPRGVPPGEAYAATLYDAFDRTRALVVAFSRHPSASPHVLREVTHAMDRYMIFGTIHLPTLQPVSTYRLLLTIAELEDGERREYLEALDVAQTGLARLIEAG